MSNLTTQIAPLSHGKPSVEAQCQYITVYFGEGNEYATARINFVDADGNVNAAYDVSFTSEDLELWGHDDTFVITSALQKLGVTFKA